LYGKREKELFQELKNGVITFNEDLVNEVCLTVLKEGISATDAVNEGLVPAMQAVGELYEQGEYFVPELLMCADAMYAGLNSLKEHIAVVAKRRISGTVLIGVVQGDIHDIGKNIVKLMLELTGLEVYDLGNDVPPEVFVEEQLRTNADLVCLSAMMTSSMLLMKDIIAKIKEKNKDVMIMVGGAPLTPAIAEKFGADGFAENAVKAQKKAVELLSIFRNRF
jgi:methanogenic corrinoid protein MtbC1